MDNRTQNFLSVGQLAVCLCFFFIAAEFYLGYGAVSLRPDQYASQPLPPAQPGGDWQLLSNPETRGWSKAALEAARQKSEEAKLHAVMIVDDGRLIAAWGATREKYYVASVRKSYLSALFGSAVAKGAINLDATLADYDINDVAPALTDGERKATVRDLLTSRSGVYHNAAAASDDQRGKRPARSSQAPGAFWFYNNWDFNALGTIFEKQIGGTIFKAFAAQIASPTGMQDFTPATDGRYDRIRESNHPAYHFDMTARDMARFGLLLLRKGRWGEAQLIPSAWVEEATRPHVKLSTELGAYGYMWWIHNDDIAVQKAGVPSGSFSAQGNFGQMILVVPTRSLVIILRGKVGGPKVEGAKALDVLRAIFNAHRPKSS